MPPLATLVHVGRRSGKEYRIPVMAFPTDDGFAFALTYGPKVDWVRNVLAAGHCRLVRRREEIDLDDPRRMHGDEGMELVARFTRPVLRMLNVDEFLTMQRAAPSEVDAE